MNRIDAIVLAACASTSLFSPVAGAQTEDAWQFNATIYLYLPSISGTTVFPQSGSGSDVGVDASTIIDSLKSVFMGTLEARKGRWGGFTDVVYIDLGNSVSGSRGLTIGGVPLPVDVSADATLGLYGTAWTTAGTYRAVMDPKSPVDLLAGARLLDITESLDWQLSGNFGSIPTPDWAGSQKANLNIWDAIVGVKGRYGFGAEKKWFIPYYFDVGTGESKLTWQAMTGIGYSFKWGDLMVAWRQLDYTMKPGSNIESLSFNGPSGFVGASFNW
jgi:hypothetical protein